MPSISVLGSAAPLTRAPRTERGSAPTDDADAPKAEEAEPARQRRSVPTLESVGNASAKALSAGGFAPVTDDSIPDFGRFPSEIPTSRPPDVLGPNPSPPSGSGARPSPSPSSIVGGAARSSRPPRSSIPPQSTVANLPSTRTGKLALPSVMLGADVEVEADNTARRAMRASRATVRLELPANFGRPGSPLVPGLSFPGAAGADAEVSSDPFRRASFPALLRQKRILPFAIVGLCALVACLLFLLRPRYGSLVVTALGPGQRAVDNIQIFVDEAPLCATSPCRISGLALGTHKLRATAAGLASRDVRSVEISAGEEATANIELAPAGAEVLAGGLSMPAGDKEYTLFIDDRRVGKLPQTVSGLASGKHWVKLVPEDGSSSIEKGVLIQAGQVVDVDPKPAKRDKALVTIRLSPESEGASVTLDEAFLLDFPAELELDPKTTHVLSATKPGYEDFTLTLQLGDGESEKLVEVALSPLDGSAHHPHPQKVHKASPPKPAQSGPAIDPTQGLLNISSVPPSQIILNGRPLGTTPKTAIVVPGDSLQTIVFVHPKMGRRRAQKFVPAGKERTVSIRF
jgi:serine/threonine-protein kinase